MSNWIVRETGNLFDPITGKWVGVIDAAGNEQLVAIASPIPLTSDYTLTAADDQRQFIVTTPIIVTCPLLSPPPAVSFICPTGSVTLRPTGGATINGAALDVVKSAATDPAGFGITPTYLADGAWTTTSGVTTWAALGGSPGDSASLAAYVTQRFTDGAKKSANYTFTAADHGGYVWLSAQAADKVFTFDTSLPNNFRCRVGYINNTSAAGRLKLTASGSSFVWTANQATGAIQTGGNVFMGTASSACIAMADVYHEGSAPGNTFTISPVCGVFSAT